MWATHPQSHEREENAKRVYLAAPVDAHSAWSLFDAPEALREQVTARLLGQPPEGAEPAEPATSMERLEMYFARTYYDRAYRGVYLNRSPVLEVASAAELAEPLGPVGTSELDALYPPSLAGELERLHDLERERALLLAVRDGIYSAQGGLVHFRGRALRRGQLTTAIGEVDADLAAVRGALREHDRRCRSVHRAAARQVGGSWEAHLQGTAALLHYAEHVLADLRDAQGMLANAVAVATATRKASKKDVTRVLQAADQVYDALEAIYAQAAALDIGPALAGRLQWPDWPAVLGEFKLGRASRAQINPWLHASRSWVDHAANALSALRNAALEQLLESEAAVARQVREGGEPTAAPAAPSAPTGYAIATPDRARARTQRLDWWKRFQNAQGFLPGFARTALACLVVGGVLGAGWSVGKVEVFAYNGLSLPVHVDIDGQTLDLAPHASGSLSLDSVAHHAIRTSDMHGHLIEAFEADANNYARTVYNVAGASPLVQWMAIYGGSVDHSNNWHLGNPRWTTTHAVDIFRDPPRSVRTQGGPATREVLTAPAITPDQGLLELLDDGSQRTALIATHARWDAPHSPDLLTWLELASTQPGYRALIDARLANDPDDVPALRARQDAAGADREAVCGRDRARAAAAPDQADLAYVAARCNDDETARNTAFDVGHARWPANAWFAYASAYTAAEHGRWQQALQAMQQADRGEPALRGYLALDIARIRRLVAANPQADLADLLPRSPRLRAFVGLERDTDVGDAMRGYVALARGQLDQALALTPRISDQARMLRLVAASDGASVEAVQRALALPDDQGIDGDSVWTALALDMREGRGAHAFDATLDKFRATPDGTRMVDAMLAFMRLAEQGDTERAQASLVGLPPQARGQAYAAGTVLLGRRTPAAWRMGARCLLFGAERPYFH